jgi:hypothetical protein
MLPRMFVSGYVQLRMSTPRIAAEAIEVTCRQGQTGGDPHIVNRFFLSYGALPPPTHAEMVVLVNAIISSWGTNLKSLFVTGHSLLEVDAIDIASLTGERVLQSAAVAGTDTSGSLASGTALVLQKHIARRYRGGHPRSYFGGIPQGALATAGQWSTLYQTEWATNWAAFITSLSVPALSGGPGVVGEVNISFFSGYDNVIVAGHRARSVPRPRTPPVQDLITSYTTNPRPASQRRRNLQSA